jgi:small subunit ribosomal protein S9
MAVTKKTTTKKPAVKKEIKVPEVEVVEETKQIEVEPEIEISEPVEITLDKTLENIKGDRTEKYYEAVGRRKESTARVRILTKKSSDIQKDENKGIIIVNDKPYYEYFNSEVLQEIVDAPLKKLKSLNRFKATVKVNGGGIHGQADAIKFGMSRALVKFDPNFAKKLKKAGFLTRDSREKERRKYGLKKARKGPAWSKR